MIKIDDYNDNSLDKLKTWIENASLQNQPKYFEVLVDGDYFNGNQHYISCGTLSQCLKKVHFQNLI